MTFEEFMKLEVGDRVIFDGITATVLRVTDIAKGELVDEYYMTTIARQSMRELEIAFVNPRSLKREKRYVIIHPEIPGEVHNRSVLARLQAWDPFGTQQ